MSTVQALVSILIPTYNCEFYLRQLLSSIVTQTYQNYEVLILDDGSIDNTKLISLDYSTDGRFKFFHWHKNRGVNVATSFLLGEMRGTYWAHPGADDLLEPSFLEERVKALEKHPNAVIVHGPAHYIDSTGHKIFPQLPLTTYPECTHSKQSFEILLQHNIINTPSVLVRASVTKSIAHHFLMDWKYAQDWYFWLLHLSSGLDLLWDNRPLHKYRIHDHSLTGDPSKARIRRAEIRLVPLCALSRAAQFSRLGFDLWVKWRRPLYHLWLIRAFSLWREGNLKKSDVRIASHAYHGVNYSSNIILFEILKQSASLITTIINERKSRKTQAFRVSGLAQINNHIFLTSHARSDINF